MEGAEEIWAAEKSQAAEKVATAREVLAAWSLHLCCPTLMAGSLILGWSARWLHRGSRQQQALGL